MNSDLLRVNSHARHVSNYFAVGLSLVLAIRVAEVDCKLQLAARPSRLQPVVDSGDKIAARVIPNGGELLKFND